MRKHFVGGISTVVLTLAAVLSVGGIGAGGYAVKRLFLTTQTPDIMEVVAADSREPSLTPGRGKVIEWDLNSDESSQANPPILTVQFAGTPTYWPCKETQPASIGGQALSQLPNNQCTYNPINNQDMFVYGCFVGDVNNKDLCSDPELGPVSASDTSSFGFGKTANPNTTVGGDEGLRASSAGSSTTPVAVGMAKAGIGNGVVHAQLYCNSGTGKPVLFTVGDTTPDDSVTLSAGDKLVWKNATGGKFKIVPGTGFSCPETNTAAKGCTVTPTSGPLTYTVQMKTGCGLGSAPETLIIK